MNANDDTIKRIARLEQRAAEECAKIKKSLAVSVAVYGFIFLLAAGYTTVVFTMIKERSTPKELAALVIDYAQSKLPDVKDELARQSKDNAPVLADKAVNMAHSLIPQGSQFIKTQIDTLADELISQTRNNYLPQIAVEIQKTLASFNEETKGLKDPEIAKGYAELFAESLDLELGKIIDEKAKVQMRWLLNEIATLSSKPVSRMSARELAEKRFIMYWLFLLNHGEIGDSKLTELIRTVSNLAEHVDKAFVEDED